MYFQEPEAKEKPTSTLIVGEPKPQKEDSEDSCCNEDIEDVEDNTSEYEKELESDIDYWAHTYFKKEPFVYGDPDSDNVRTTDDEVSILIKSAEAKT